MPPPLSKRFKKFSLEGVYAAGKIMRDHSRHYAKGQLCAYMDSSFVNLQPPAALLKAAAKKDYSLQESWKGTPVAGIAELRIAVASDVSRRHGCHKVKENVLITAGANNALSLLLTYIIDAGDSIVTFTPGFFNHMGLVSLHGGQTLYCALDQSTGYQPNFTVLEHYLSQGAKAILLSDPNNPLSIQFSDNSRKHIIALAKSYDAWVIVDESWATFIWNDENHAYDLNSENLILISGFAKRLSYPASRVGYIIAHESVIHDVTPIQDQTHINISRYDQEMILAGLQNDVQEYEASLMRLLAPLRNTIQDALVKSSLFETPINNASVYWWAPVKTGLSSWLIAKYLLQRGVVTIPSFICKDFEKDAPSFQSFGDINGEAIRFSYGNLHGRDLAFAVHEIANLAHVDHDMFKK